MIDTRLLKLFAWTIGVLIVLWLLAECAGPDAPDPDLPDLDRDTEQHAADCDRAWEALDLVAQVDGQNVDAVVDRIDALGTEIADPNLKAAAASYAQEAQSIAAAEPSGEALEQSRAEFRDAAALDLAMRCPVR